MHFYGYKDSPTNGINQMLIFFYQACMMTLSLRFENVKNEGPI